MTLCFHNTISVHTLDPIPGVTIWYARIPDIIASFFTNGTYHNWGVGVNELFKKENFTINCFSAPEIKAVNQFKALKKQLEWMAGRYLVKQLIHSVFLPDQMLEQIQLSYHEQGAPFVTQHPDLSFSLSHSHDFTAAACTIRPGQTLGLDIEKIAKTPDAAFLKTAFTPKEIGAMPLEADHIFTNWTIKEAFLKFIKKGFHESLHQVEIINRKILYKGKQSHVDVFTERIGKNYVLSLVYD